MTKISPATINAYTALIVAALRHNRRGLRFPELVAAVQPVPDDSRREALNAVVWHLLATHRLRLTSSRKLQLDSALEASELVLA